MNVLLRVKRPPAVTVIAHSVMVYDRLTGELAIELPIPLFLDTLALKIARVPPEDKYGALSYMLDEKAVETFGFLLGLDIDLANWEYFLESTVGNAADFGAEKLKAVEMLTEVTPHPRYARTENAHISERELVVPTLRLLDCDDRGWMSTADIIAKLAVLFAPFGRDAAIIKDRRYASLSQQFRTMILHKGRPSSFIHRGLAYCERQGLGISDEGRETVRALLR